MNNIIKEELHSRMRKARELITKVPKSWQNLLDYYDKQPLENVIFKVYETVKEGIGWEEGPVQASGFEWYYDGSYKPEALGYGYRSLEKVPDLSAFKTGQTDQAGDDFDGGVKFGANLFVDSGGFSMADVCYPLYEFLEVEQWSKHEDVFINLFTCRFLYALHIAMAHIVQSDVFKKLNITRPFYFFANNHDWSPLLVYSLDDDAELEPLGSNSSLIIEELSKFIQSIDKKLVSLKLKGEYLLSLSEGPVENLEKALFDLPYLKDGGNSLKITGDELGSFCWEALSQAEYYEKLSFESLWHYFVQTCKDEIEHIDYPLIYLFLNNPEKAVARLNEYFRKNPDLKEDIVNSAKDCARWGREEPDETRWENPVWSLHKAKDSLMAMESLI